MNRIKELTRNHPVLVFFVLAYAITWSLWTPILYGYVHNLLELTTPITLLLYFGGFGPLLAAAIVTALSGGSLRAWFGQALKWRVPIKWWLAAFFIPVLLYATMTGVHMLLGGRFNLAEVSPLWSLPGGFLSVFLWGGGNEELGWRGLALPRLQEKHGPLVSSLIIGVVWTLWHAPPGIIEWGFAKWAADLPFYTVTVTGISIVATWLYNNTDGSVLLPMVFHASVNATQSLYPVEEMFTMTGEIARVIAWLLLIVGLIIVPRLVRRTRQQGAWLQRPELSADSG